VSLPRLRAVAADARAVARVLRGALRHEVALVQLEAPPAAPGQHLLEVDVSGEGIVTLLADPAGKPSGAGHPLHLRPVTRPQMAALFAMIERLDDPSTSVPPPAADEEWSPTSEGGPDATLIDHLDPGAGLDRDSELPPSSAPIRPTASGARVAAASASPPLPASPPASPEGSPVSSGRPVPSGELIGRVIAGKYKLESSIGSGTTAAVFRAMHLDLRRHVAVKILHQQKLAQMQFVKRFKGEALAASKLEHPNVTRVMDFGQEPDGLLYLVMELLTGRSLEAVLAAEGKLPQRLAVTIAIQACSALAFAHDVGIVHRDVKPENIMIVPHRDDDGNPCDLAKVCDFGLAKLRDPEPDQEELTMGGMLCGSPAYMSPEQTRGDKIDGRTDVYSLGVTLYESLSGEFPHEAHDLAALFAKKMLQAPRKLSAVLPSVDPLLEDVVMRSLSTDPGSRHQTARILREELREVLANMEEDEGKSGNTIVAG